MTQSETVQGELLNGGEGGDLNYKIWHFFLSLFSLY